MLNLSACPMRMLVCLYCWSDWAFPEVELGNFEAHIASMLPCKSAGLGLSHVDLLLCCREALKATTINTPRIPVISNVDVQPHDDPDRIRDTLARQVCTRF